MDDKKFCIKHFEKQLNASPTKPALGFVPKADVYLGDSFPNDGFCGKSDQLNSFGLVAKREEDLVKSKKSHHQEISYAIVYMSIFVFLMALFVFFIFFFHL